MAKNQVTVVMSVKQAGAFQNALLQHLNQTNAATAAGGTAANNTSRAFTLMFGSASGMAGNLTRQLLGVGSGLGVVGAGLALLSKEFDNFKQARLDAIDPVTAKQDAAQQARLILGNMDHRKKDAYLAQLEQVATKNGAQPGDVFKAFEAAVGAGGSPEDAMEAIRTMAPIIKLDEKNQEAPGALMDYASTFPAGQRNMQEILGRLLKVAPEARNESFGDITGLIRGIYELKSRGESDEKALALAGALTQTMKDKHGPRASTAISSYIKRQDEAMAEVEAITGDAEASRKYQAMIPSEKAEYIRGGADPKSSIHQQFMLAYMQGMAEATDEHIRMIAMANGWKQSHWGEMTRGAQMAFRGIYNSETDPAKNPWKANIEKAEKAMTTGVSPVRAYQDAVAERTETKSTLDITTGMTNSMLGSQEEMAVSGSILKLREVADKVMGRGAVSRGLHGMWEGVEEWRRSSLFNQSKPERALESLDQIRSDVADDVQRREMGTLGWMFKDDRSLPRRAAIMRGEGVNQQEKEFFENSSVARKALIQQIEKQKSAPTYEHPEAYDYRENEKLPREVTQPVDDPAFLKRKLPDQSSLGPGGIFRFQVEDQAGRLLSRAMPLPRPIGRA